jgi:diaminohydroxyphosphoribosylaminopyrimidine deaminase/5-amino-6-(5-phosphoribosylamino)uracil reductase
MRVILDSHLRIPLHAQVLSKGPAEVVIVTTRQAAKPKVADLQRLGATVLIVPAEQGRVSLNACLADLGKRGITSVMLEGGSEMNASALSADLVQRLHLYVAPTLLGGQDAKGLLGGTSPTSLSDAILVKDIQVKRIGRDFFIDAMVATPSRRTH